MWCAFGIKYLEIQNCVIQQHNLIQKCKFNYQQLPVNNCGMDFYFDALKKKKKNLIHAQSSLNFDELRPCQCTGSTYARSTFVSTLMATSPTAQVFVHVYVRDRATEYVQPRFSPHLPQLDPGNAHGLTHTFTRCLSHHTQTHTYLPVPSSPAQMCHLVSA